MVAAALFVVVLAATACLPAPGNPNGVATVPAEAQAVNTSTPTRVIGNGTPASCTSQAVVSAMMRSYDSRGSSWKAKRPWLTRKRPSAAPLAARKHRSAAIARSKPGITYGTMASRSPKIVRDSSAASGWLAMASAAAECV